MSRLERILLGPAAALLLVCGAAGAFAGSAARDLDAFYALRTRDPAGALRLIAAAADRNPKDLRVQMEAAYALLAVKDPRALAVLERAAALAPDRKELLKQLGYARLSAGDAPGARTAFRAALVLDPSDQDLRMQLVYVEDGLGAKRSAAAEAAVAARAGSPRAADACAAYKVLAGAPDRLFPAPWFGEFYAAPEYRSRDRVAIGTGQIRAGRSFADDAVEAYGTLRFTRDSRSEGGGLLGPTIFYDNAAVLGFGLRVRPSAAWPVSFFAEQGAAADLIDRGRDTWRNDTRAGAVLSWSWIARTACPSEVTLTAAPVFDVYADAVWYSRYDDVIAYGRMRPGLRVLEAPAFALDAYGLLGGSADTAGRAGERSADFGAGAALTLFAPLRTTLRAELVRTTSGTRPTATDARLRIEQQLRF